MPQQINRREFLLGASLLSLAPLAVHRLEASKPQSASQPARPSTDISDAPNILFLVFDTLSAEHMSLFGYPRQTTPNLERFAQRASVYHNHYAGANFTTPGTASLLTGTYPWSHRAFNHAGTIDARYQHQNLFAAFEGNGYTRIAYTHNMLANSILHRCAGIDAHLNPSTFCLTNGTFADRLFPNDADVAMRAFDDLLFRRGEVPGSFFLSLADRIRMRVEKQAKVRHYAQQYPRGVPELFKLTFVLEDAIDGIIDTVESAQNPYLAYFHLLPPHEPYHPRQEFVGLFKDQWQTEAKTPGPFSQKIAQDTLDTHRLHYDEYLTYADAEFGRLLDHLEQNGTLDNTIVVFTSDHGQLFERGIHGHVTEALYDPIVRVPLLISVPGQLQREDIYTPTSCVDLLPTLIHLTGRGNADWSEGQILPNFSQLASAERAAVFAIEAKQNPKKAPLTKATFMLRTEEHLLIQYLGYGSGKDSTELFALREDPDCRLNVYSDQAGVARELTEYLAHKLGQVNSTSS